MPRKYYYGFLPTKFHPTESKLNFAPQRKNAPGIALAHVLDENPR